MEIRSLSQLEKVLKQKIQETMLDDVSVKATQLGQMNVVSEVYRAYSPTFYQRTTEMMTSFEINPITDGIEFSHNRTDGDRNVSEVVEYGHEASEGYEYPSYYENGSPKEYMLPRPFFAETVNDLKNGEFKKALKEGLIQKGLNVQG